MGQRIRHIYRSSRQCISLPWICAFLTLTSFALTITYALHPEIFSCSPIVGGSQGSAIRALSYSFILTNIFLAATISGALDKLPLWLIEWRWLNYFEFLVLQANTAIGGHLGSILDLNGTRIMARVWSVLRLTAIAVPPILNLLIWYDVRTQPIFPPVKTESKTWGYSMDDFNKSIADILQVAPDLLFSATFADFLSSNHLFDITAESDRKDCTVSWSTHKRSYCRSRYFVPGGIESSVPAILNSSDLTQSDIVLAVDQGGYVLLFEDGNPQWQYNATLECSAYGLDPAAFALCFRNGENGEILAQLTICPHEIASRFTCLSDSSWLTGPGWRTNLTTLYRRATVAYTWADGKVLSYAFSDNAAASISRIDAPDLLEAFDKVMKPVDNSTSLGQLFTAMGFGSRHVIPFYVYWYFLEFGDLAKASENARKRSQTAFQSLLSILIYHCQPKELHAISGLGFDQELPIAKTIVSSLPIAKADTLIVPAKVNYTIIVSPSSLIPFIVIGSATLLLCVTSLLLSSCTSAGRRAQNTTAFPLNGHRMMHEIVDRNDRQVTEEDFHHLRLKNKREQRRELETWRVRPAFSIADGVHKL